MNLVVSGIFVHAYATGRLPLCLAWVLGFITQGLVRSFIFGIPWIVPLIPMTSAAFILFTLYMFPDPATTPLNPWRQIFFGISVALVYGILISMHIVFGFFLALFVVYFVRGLLLFSTNKLP